METAIRNIITNAVTEIEMESRDRTEPLSGNEFLKALFAKLFPSEVEVVVKVEKPSEAQTVEVPAVVAAEPVKEKKKPGPKPKLDADGNPIPKKPRAKKAKAESDAESVGEAAPAAPATPEQAPKPEAEAPPAPKKPRAKKEKGPVNLDKMTPTQTKQLKKLAEEAKVEADKKDMLAYVNGLTAEDYAARTLEEHMKAFLHSKAGGSAAPVSTPEAEPEKELDVLEMEFKGQTYFVNPEDKRIYREENGSHVFAGYVGMAAFADVEFVTAFEKANTA